MELEELLTPSDVAKILKLSPPCIYRWAKEGILPCIRIGSSVRFRREDIVNLIESNRRIGE